MPCTSTGVNRGALVGDQKDVPGKRSAMLPRSSDGREYLKVRTAVVPDLRCWNTVKLAWKISFARAAGKLNSSQSPALETGEA